MIRRAFQMMIGGTRRDMAREDWRQAIERVRGAYAETTLAANIRDFGVFADWCEARGEAPTPAAPALVGQFIDQQSRRCAVRTVQRRIHVIRRVHQWSQLPDPTSDQAVQLALRRAVKLRAKPPRQAMGLSAALRDELVAACPDTLAGARDRAMIMLGYDTLCRRSELVALLWEQVTTLPDGTAKFFIAKAKNDPESEGRYAYASAGTLAALRDWGAAADISTGPIFRTLRGEAVGASAMHPRIVNRTLQSAAARAGLPGDITERLSSHSLRVGAAQDLAIAGKSVLQIMRAGRWYSLNGMMGYVRKADVNVWGAFGDTHPSMRASDRLHD